MAKPKICAVPDCGKPSYVRGWCTVHYQRWKKTGDPLKGGWPRRAICETEGCERKVFARGLCSTHYMNGDFRPACSIDGCSRKAAAKGLCSAHYKRFMRHGSPYVVMRQANGTYRKWLEAHVNHEGDVCLIWPFARDRNGYGPSREMCRLAHGEPPTPDHQAAHSCANGHEGCVHPVHLRWATRLENQGEMVAHGHSNQGERCPITPLTENDVREIRRLKGTMSQRAIAKRYGICHQTVGNIHRRKTWWCLE